MPCGDKCQPRWPQTFLESASKLAGHRWCPTSSCRTSAFHFRQLAMARLETWPFLSASTRPHLKDVFAPSCLSCFDYVNAGSRILVVGTMGCHFRPPIGWWFYANPLASAAGF